MRRIFFLWSSRKISAEKKEFEKERSRSKRVRERKLSEKEKEKEREKQKEIESEKERERGGLNVQSSWQSCLPFENRNPSLPFLPPL
jgi:hypothetical protein